MMGFPRWTLRITHKSGITVKTDSKHFRSPHKAKERLINIIKSKLWAEQNKENYSAFDYELPDNEPYRRDLKQQRKRR